MNPIAAIAPAPAAAAPGNAAAGAAGGKAVPTLGMTFDQLLGVQSAALAEGAKLPSVEQMAARLANQDLLGEDGLPTDPDALLALVRQLAGEETADGQTGEEGSGDDATASETDLEGAIADAAPAPAAGNTASQADPAAAAVAAPPTTAAQPLAAAAAEDGLADPDADTMIRLAALGDDKQGSRQAGDPAAAARTATPAADLDAPAHMVAEAAHAVAKPRGADAKAGQTPADILPDKPQTGPGAAIAEAAAGNGGRSRSAGEDRPLQSPPSVAANAGTDKPGPSFQATLASQRPAAPPVPVADQVAVQLRKAGADGIDRFTIRLQPASLGNVEVRLEIGDDNRVQARIVVDRSETLDMLRRDSGSLERALGSSGLQTDDSSLEFSLRGQNGGNGQGREGAGAGEGPAGDGPDGEDQPDADRANGEQHVTVRTDGWTATGRLDLRI